MYFVVIDLNQLHTRLINCTGDHATDVERWLVDCHFVRSQEGWLGSAESLNRLSCSEILYSERRLLAMPQGRPAYGQAAG